MKKDLFWKVMAVLFFIWLCAWLWSNSIIVANITGEGRAFKTNKLTGSVYLLKGGGWAKLPLESK